MCWEQRERSTDSNEVEEVIRVCMCGRMGLLEGGEISIDPKKWMFYGKKNDIELFQARIKLRNIMDWVGNMLLLTFRWLKSYHENPWIPKDLRNTAHSCTTTSSKNDTQFCRVYGNCWAATKEDSSFFHLFIAVLYTSKPQWHKTRICNYFSWYWGFTRSRQVVLTWSLSRDYSQLVAGEEIIWRLSWAEYPR